MTGDQQTKNGSGIKKMFQTKQWPVYL